MRGWRPPAVAADAALALVLTVLYLPGATDAEPASLVVPLAVAQTLPLVFRRLAPRIVLGITLLAGIVFNLGFADSPTLPLGLFVSFYTGAPPCDRPGPARAAERTAPTLPGGGSAAAGPSGEAARLP